MTETIDVVLGRGSAAALAELASTEALRAAVRSQPTGRGLDFLVHWVTMGREIGYMSCRWEASEATLLYFDALYVARAWQRCGLYTNLCRRMPEWGRERGIIGAIATASGASLPVFCASGFQQVDESRADIVARATALEAYGCGRRRERTSPRATRFAGRVM